jgi:predicted amidohydrolase YtcJ
MRKLLTNFRWWETGEPEMMLIEDDLVVQRATSIDTDAPSVDMHGDFLLPKFVDSHCHILPTGLDLQKLHLGVATNHAEVLDLLSARHRLQPEGWLLAVHYDQTRYESGRHLTRAELDKISSTRPILLRHSNGHASVANSAALAAAGADRDTSDPAGGKYGRDESGELDGTLFEAAHERVTAAVPCPTPTEMLEAILAAAHKMNELQICRASDMMTGRFNLQEELDAYEQAAIHGPMEVRLYVQWRDVFGPRAPSIGELRSRFERLDRNTNGRARVAGIKIFADGAIGSATAAIYGQYTGASPSGPLLSTRKSALPAEVSGQLMYSPEKLIEMTRVAHEAGFQVCVHSIGDYASDLVMDAFEATGEANRHRIEHAMILSDRQIERLASLGCFVSFQPEFLLRFGHSYLRQLGPERAAILKRTRSVLDAGIPLSFSSDRPIVAGNPWDGIGAASHRPDGFDQRENCTRAEAIHAYTREGDRVNGDQPCELLPGQKADFQSVPFNPLTFVGNSGTP